MNSEDIKYEINNYIEIRKNLWTAIIVLTGGLAGLLLTLQNIKLDLTGLIKIGLLISGSFLDYLLFVMMSEVNNDIRDLITKLKKEDKK